MNVAVADTWEDFNQRYLTAELDRIRSLLDVDQSDSSTVSPPHPHSVEADLPPPAITSLATIFGLSSFERDLLLLCAAVELNADFGALCAQAQGQPDRPYPTFSLALATLSDAHWSALMPAAPLRFWRMIEIANGGTLTTSPLRVDERILHFLTGVSYLDERLAGLVTIATLPEQLPASHRAVADKVAACWSGVDGDVPIVQLVGRPKSGEVDVAATAAAYLGLNLQVLSAQSIPQIAGERELLIRLLEREALLDNSALLVNCHRTMNPGNLESVADLVERLNIPNAVAARDPVRFSSRTSVRFDVDEPSSEERSGLWRRALGGRAQKLNGGVERLVAHFSMGFEEIRAASRTVLMEAENTDDLSGLLWDACREQARVRMDNLAQRIVASADWKHLVLPEMQRTTLRQIAAHVRQRSRVYEDWGFARGGGRDLGISALFEGASGTGKTMAAEVLANELRLDLYRIDLSAVVSKYIGETEKNLRLIFDAAESSGAILLFDEADALFGKRSEVRDSHDRYANIEVSYLLQRMESYRGLAILTTNMKQAIDTAFLRRIRFIVHFPFPDSTSRSEIWRHIFPVATPAEGLVFERLAQLNVSGGNIRNIALSAAFLAADQDSPVTMECLLQAARSEYGKLQRPLTAAEIGNWT